MSRISKLFLGSVLYLVVSANLTVADIPNSPLHSDYNGDSKFDVLWRHKATGQILMWLMNGNSATSNLHVDTVGDVNWQIVGIADYNGDNSSDVLWRHMSSGQISMWQMAGGTVIQNLYVDFVSDLNWQIVTSADFNGDNNADVLWRHSGTGQVSMWLMNGNIIAANLYVDTVTDRNWRIVGSGDYDGDNRSDLLLRNTSTGQIELWLMNGAMKIASQYVDTVTNQEWQIVGSNDFDGDSTSDILWRHSITGQMVLWSMNGSTKTSNSYVDTVGQDWQIVAIGDFDGDSNSDVLWRHQTTGRLAMWLMNGAAKLANLYVDTVTDRDWEVMIGQLRGTSGLQQRTTNLSCIAPQKPTVNTSIDTIQAFAGVGAFNQPVVLLQAPDDSTQWYLVEKDGLVHRFDNDASASGRELFVDISGIVDSSQSESGLLGIAFHPDYETNRYVFLSYTTTGPDGTYRLTSRLSRFQSLDNGLTLDPNTEVILLNQDQRYTNHNGGNIAFGPDGYLYLGLGDGGNGGDPGNRAQNTKNLFGTIVRIDVDAGSPYEIPVDNPFYGNSLCDVSTTGIDSAAACPEIFAWGFRNPWRWSFDSVSGVLWLADVGQNAYEEVDIIERGGNYGWSTQEGFACFNPSSGCDTSNLVQPILAYDHAVGQSITGGFVYRGTVIPELIGRYVFADYVAGKLFASTSQGDGNYDYELLADTGYFISSFGQDESGELYFLDYTGGTIRKIIQFGGTSNDTIPTALSDTGCTSSVNVTLPASGLIPYEPLTSFWSDGATKERFYAIPDSLTVDVDIDGDWQFPIGSVLVKNFRLFGSLIETRLFMRHSNGDWAGYVYEWNSDDTEAIRVIGGKSKEINGQTWMFPSESQCMACHTNIAGFSLGLEHSQLNKAFLYPNTGIIANQLLTADAIDVLTDPLPVSPVTLPSLAGPPASGFVLDFNLLQTNSYSDQDEHANVTVEDGGLTIALADNTARKTVQTFNITTDTVLEFDFESTFEGEIHGIGFDENNIHNDAVRYFALYGTQTWSGSNQDFNDYTGDGTKHYVIPVGRYYTGGAMSLLLIGDMDAGTGIGPNSRFSNVRIFSCQSCLDFDVVSTDPYSDQDKDNNVAVANNGATLVLMDNTWRQTNQSFDVTADTILEFDFESTAEGEIHGIGFDENNDWSDAVRIFKLYGTQNTSDITDFETYSAGGRTHYQIHVGQYYTGSSMRLVFANDDDASIGSNSRFSNVRIFSCPDCLDFNSVSTSSYSNQDKSSDVSIADSGATLVLANNTWRRSDQTFNITANTILEFDFESTAKGEIHGIGFDENNDWSDTIRIFKLYGTQNTSDISDFETYMGIGRAHFLIPVGQYYTGSGMSLVLANDDDAVSGSDSRFSNVVIREVLPQDQATLSMQDQVRSYLHTNCSGCHRPFGPTQTNIDLRFDTTWSDMNVCAVLPQLGSLGVSDAKIIALGDSTRSILINRMSRRDAYGMPPLGSNLVDTAAVQLISTWIDSLTACP